MTCHAMAATWPVALQRLVEATTAIMPLLALFVLPVLLRPVASSIRGCTRTRSPTPTSRELLAPQAPLHESARSSSCAPSSTSLVWIVVCVGVARLLDGDGPRRRAGLERRACARSRRSLLPALGITGSCAAFDWLMSLSPDWYSTMYGLYVLRRRLPRLAGR